MNILEEIIAYKKEEVKRRSEHRPAGALERSPFFTRPALSMKQFLLDKSRTGIIAEFKRHSPSKGSINAQADVAQVTASYAAHASGLSVLTDEKFFGGSEQDLLDARFNDIPILRKDFMVHEYQLLEAKAMGADVVLLIAACLTAAEVDRMATRAKSLGLEVLLEIHNSDELGHICDAVDMVGVNNRDLKTFAVDIRTSLELLPCIPASKMAVSESGISSVESILTLRRAGFKGFLIGEHFMREADPALAFTQFVDRLKASV